MGDYFQLHTYILYKKKSGNNEYDIINNKVGLTHIYLSS